MATVRDIATRLGVSPATVSRSLNGSSRISADMRAKVVGEAKRVGYALPRKVEPVGPPSVGIAFANRTSGPRFSGYDATVWSGAARAAATAECSLEVIDLNWRRPGEPWADWLRRLGVASLILRVDADSRHLAEEIAGSGAAVVVVADWFDPAGVGCVYCDSAPATRDAITHLLSLGHRRVGLVHNPVMDTDHLDRVASYRAALGSAGLPFEQELVIEAIANMDGGAAALNRLLALPEPPTAIFFCDPPMTVGALRRALEVGLRVPDEMSIVGVDDETTRRLTFPIYTAVCQDAGELGFQAGRWAASAAHTLTNDPKAAVEPLRLRYDAMLEINGSTAAPPDAPVRMMPNGHRVPVRAGV